MASLSDAAKAAVDKLTGKGLTAKESAEKDFCDTWVKRIDAAKDLKEKWEEDYRVETCYNYWRGEQLTEPMVSGERKVQVNKIHPEVRNQIPSLYFYHPFARITAQPELADTPGTSIDEQMQLLQDTANHLIRVPSVGFKDNTLIALKEAHWALGVVEVGYSADYDDLPDADVKPPLKEQKDTKIDTSKKKDDEDDVGFLKKEIARMKPKGERFFVKHIPAKQILIAVSDRPLAKDNDWVGYWEDVPLEDVKRSPAYKNTKDLKPSSGDKEYDKLVEEKDEQSGTPKRVRLFKIWDLRTGEKLVLAENHKRLLLRRPFKRCPLKFLRFDVDPYHFYPRPPIYNKLGPQDEYNDSREYLRKLRKAMVPRFTYDEDAIDAEQVRKFERNELGIMVPRHAGTHQAIEPVAQPSFSENAIQGITISDKEFKDVGGIGGDARVAETKTATQAKIAEVKEQVQDNFDRILVADWLAEIIKELLYLAVDNMQLDRWVATNVAPDSMYAPMEMQKVQQTYMALKAQQLVQASQSVEWDLTVDVESLSPVSEEEKFQKWMQGLSFIGNPAMAMVFAAAPDLLKYTLKLMGLRSAREQEMIVGAMGQLMQMQMQMAQAGGKPGPGISPMPGGSAPGTPSPAAQQGTPGGPQPGGPPGPGASVPS